MLSCTSCDIAFGDNGASFLDHMSEAHSNDRIHCTFCNQIFASGLEYACHFLEEHGADGAEANCERQESLPCPVCPFQTTDSDFLLAHFMAVHEENNSDTGGEKSSICPICNIKLAHHEADKHVNSHFDDQQPSCSAAEEIDRQAAQLLNDELRQQEERAQFEALQKRYGMASGANGYRRQGREALRNQYSAGKMTLGQLHDRQMALNWENNSGRNISQPVTGLIEKMQILNATWPSIAETHLCSSTDHYSSTSADFGFGCGYRNTQMLLSALIQQEAYKETLWRDSPLIIPSVPKLQELIEKAWDEGFDHVGKMQLGGKLMQTRKWIGATEVAAFLSSFRVRVEIIDFHRPSGPERTHPALFEWVYQYFSSAHGFVPPIYLQHEGHSRTIVGIEVTRRGDKRLLIFDPSHRRQRMTQMNKAQDLGILRKGRNELKKDQFQLLVVRGIMQSSEERERSKTGVNVTKVPP